MTSVCVIAIVMDVKTTSVNVDVKDIVNVNGIVTIARIVAQEYSRMIF
jgi:hypothetical protein